MARSGGSSPSVLRMGRDSHGSAAAARGHAPSLRPPSTSTSKLCSRASNVPRIARRGWQTIRRAHIAFLGQRAEQHGIGAGFDGRQARGFFFKRCYQSGRRCSRIATPEPRGARFGVCSGERFGGCCMHGRNVCNRNVACFEDIGQWRQCRRDLCEPGCEARGDSLVRFFLCLAGNDGDRIGNSVKARIGARAAQTETIELAHLAAEIRRRLAAGGERMLEQREQRHGREAFDRRFGEERQERARRRYSRAGGQRNRRWRYSSGPFPPPRGAPDCGPA